MPMQKVLVSVPVMRLEPRGALWAGQLASWLQGFVAEVRAAMLAAADAARARSAEARLARNRAEVVAMARRYASTQPEFAKDLFAAAGDHRRER